MLKRTRVIWNCVFVCLAVVSLSWLFGQKSFHLKSLVSNGETAYEPGFFYSDHEKISKKNAFRQIKNGKLVAGEEYVEGYRGAYPKAAEQELAQLGYDEVGRQLMYYHRYPIGKVYVYDRWHGEGYYWNVAIAKGQDVRQFPVARGAFDSVVRCVADENHIYLHQYTGRNELVITRIEVETGAQKEYSVSLKKLDWNIHNKHWFNPRTEQLLFFEKEGSTDEVRLYSFQTGEQKTMVLNQSANWLLMTEDGYLAARVKTGVVALRFYDLNWIPQPEKEVQVSFRDYVSGAWLKPYSDFYQEPTMYLADDIIYGCIQGEEALWYYAINLETKQLTTLWEIRHPKGKMELRDYFLFHKETGCEPYPTLF